MSAPLAIVSRGSRECLLPRIKRINKTRLYRPAAGDSGAWPWLEPALTRPIRWDLIASQYDQLIKYARLTSAITLVWAW